MEIDACQVNIVFSGPFLFIFLHKCIYFKKYFEAFQERRLSPLVFTTNRLIKSVSFHFFINGKLNIFQSIKEPHMWKKMSKWNLKPQAGIIYS